MSELKVILHQDNEKHVVLWEKYPESEFELECIYDCVQAAIKMAHKLERSYCPHLLTVYIEEHGVTVEFLDFDHFKEWFKEWFKDKIGVVIE